jgi:hypothetical protein
MMGMESSVVADEPMIVTVSNLNSLYRYRGSSAIPEIRDYVNTKYGRMRRAQDESPPSEVAAVLKGHPIFL